VLAKWSRGQQGLGKEEKKRLGKQGRVCLSFRGGTKKEEMKSEVYPLLLPLCCAHAFRIPRSAPQSFTASAYSDIYICLLEVTPFTVYPASLLTVQLSPALA